MPWRSSSGGFGGGAGARLAADAPRPGSASLGQWIWYACDSAPGSPESRRGSRTWSHAGSCVGCAARGRLRVEAGHDHDAVVVVRGGDRRLDLAVAAALEQPAVDRAAACWRLLGAQRAVVGGADVVAALARPRTDCLTAASSESAGRRRACGPAAWRAGPRPASGPSAPCRPRRGDRAVRRRVGPVGGALHVRRGDVGQDNAHQHRRGDGESRLGASSGHRPNPAEQSRSVPARVRRFSRGPAERRPPTGAGGPRLTPTQRTPITNRLNKRVFP